MYGKRKTDGHILYMWSQTITRKKHAWVVVLVVTRELIVITTHDIYYMYSKIATHHRLYMFF